jgi:hypothetical protein
MGVRSGNTFGDVICHLQFNLCALAPSAMIASTLKTVQHTQTLDKQENAVCIMSD